MPVTAVGAETLEPLPSTTLPDRFAPMLTLLPRMKVLLDDASMLLLLPMA